MSTVQDTIQEHLEQANEVRIGRANLRRDLQRLPSQTAREQVAAVLTDPPYVLETLMVGKLLQWVPRLGPVAAERMLQRLHINPRRTLVRSRSGMPALTARQRHELAAVLIGAPLPLDAPANETSESEAV